MKKLFIILLLFLNVISLFAKKNASLYISPNNETLNTLFISHIYVYGKSKTFHKHVFFDSDFKIENIDFGEYRVEFSTYFNDKFYDTISVTKNKKYKLSYPKKTIYEKVSDLTNLIQDTSIINQVNIVIFGAIGDLTFYTLRIHINKEISIYTKTFYGYDDNYEFFKSNTSYFNVIDELIDFCNLAKLKCPVCKGNMLSDQERGTARVMINKKYIEFEICPKENVELNKLIEILRNNRITETPAIQH